MAYNPAEPSMTDVSFAQALSFIRENFRAIVEGDAGVISKITIRSNPIQKLIMESSATATQARARLIGISQNAANGYEYGIMTVNADYDGAAPWFRDSTTRTAWSMWMSTDVAQDMWSVQRAAAAANPITWITLLSLDGVGKLTVSGNNSASAITVLGNTVQSAVAVNYILQAGSGKYGWSIGAQNFVHDTLEFMATTAAGGGTFASPVMVLSQTGFVRIGTSGPSTRLHVGIGGTGTQAEIITIDSGSGSGGVSGTAMYRNAVLKAAVAVSGSAGGQIAGDVANDLCIRNSQKIMFSCDLGTTAHAWLTTGGYWFATSMVSTGVAANSGGGTICYGGTTAAGATAGGGAAPPATVDGYIIINIAGNQKKIPYYAN